MVELGQVVDNSYKICSVLQENELSRFYKAVRIKDNKTITVKVMEKEFYKSSEAFQRLCHEEEIVSLLKHRNIAKIYPPDSAKSLPYQIMEFFDGLTLAELMARHRWLEIKSACRIIIQVLSALECMHSRGVIHQDLKPENIIVSNSYEIKIADFGLAYYSGSVFSRLPASESRESGASGISTGKPVDSCLSGIEYTSPQKFYGDISTEGDVYSAGVIFYRMFTGHLPYTGEEIISFPSACPVAASSFGARPVPEAVSPTHYNKSIQPRLVNVVMKAIALRKEDRFSSAASFSSSLLKKRVFK